MNITLIVDELKKIVTVTVKKIVFKVSLIN